MGDTKIEWATKVWNPVTGCTKVSQGCKHCYAETLAKRWFATQYPPNADGTPRRFTDVRTHNDRIAIPRSWRKPQRVFVNSMSDLFHPDVPGTFINLVWNEMFNTRKHVYLILTKRPERLLEWTRIKARACGWPEEDIWPEWMWVGTSVEDDRVVARVDTLCQVPAAVRFISAEPLIGPLAPALAPYMEPQLPEWPFNYKRDPDVTYRMKLNGRWYVRKYESIAGAFSCEEWRAPIHWLIAGGESGAGARLMEGAWACDLRDQCFAAGTAYFFKQCGEVLARELGLKDRKGGKWEELPFDLKTRQFPNGERAEVHV